MESFHHIEELCVIVATSSFSVGINGSIVLTAVFPGNALPVPHNLAQAWQMLGRAGRFSLDHGEFMNTTFLPTHQILLMLTYI